MFLCGLALLVIVHNRRAPINKIFGFSLFTIAGWIASISIALSRPEIPQIVFFGRFAFAFSGTIPFALLWMFSVLSATQSVRSRRIFHVSAFVCVAFAALSLFSPLVVANAALAVPRPNLLYGPLHRIFGLYFLLCMGVALHLAWRNLRSASGIQRVQLRYLLAGLVLGTTGGVSTNLVVPIIWKTSQYSFIGPYFVLIYALLSTHAIIRYRLMDTRVFVKKSVVYILGLAVAVAIFVGIAIVVSRVIGEKGDSVPITAALAIAVAAAIIFQPLKRWLEESFNRYVYRQSYDYQRIVREASRQLSTILEPNALLNYLTSVIEGALKAEAVAAYLRNDSTQPFTLKAAHPVVVEGVELALSAPYQEPSSVLLLLERKGKLLVRDDLQAPAGEVDAAAKIELKSLGAELVFPFFHEGDISGLLIVGPKRSGDPYFAEDLDLVATLASQAAIAIKNAQLYSQVVLVNEYIENILSTMESGVVAISADGKITLFNAAAQRLTHLDGKDTRGLSAEVLPVSISTALKRTATEGQSPEHFETLITGRDGRMIPVICSTSPLRHRNETISGAVAVFSDLTRLKDLERDKRRAERLASIGALASGIAHEIKNPLVAIRVFAELLPERFSDDEFRNEFSTIAMREIDRIDNLVARLRGLATPGHQRLIPMDLRAPLEETLGLLRGQLEQTRISIKLIDESSTSTITGDHDQLKQLFLNVLMNAIDAMEQGGEIMIRVSDRMMQEVHTVAVDVSDVGPGIPDSVLSKIFEPFVTTKPQGTGLGLSICRGIADAHRGVIRASNNQNGPGATITIEFDAADDTAAAQITALDSSSEIHTRR